MTVSPRPSEIHTKKLTTCLADNFGKSIQRQIVNLGQFGGCMDQQGRLIGLDPADRLRRKIRTIRLDHQPIQRRHSRCLPQVIGLLEGDDSGK